MFISIRISHYLHCLGFKYICILFRVAEKVFCITSSMLTNSKVIYKLTLIKIIRSAYSTMYF